MMKQSRTGYSLSLKLLIVLLSFAGSFCCQVTARPTPKLPIYRPPQPIETLKAPIQGQTQKPSIGELPWKPFPGQSFPTDKLQVIQGEIRQSGLKGFALDVALDESDRLYHNQMSSLVDKAMQQIKLAEETADSGESVAYLFHRSQEKISSAFIYKNAIRYALRKVKSDFPLEDDRYSSPGEVDAPFVLEEERKKVLRDLDRKIARLRTIVLQSVSREEPRMHLHVLVRTRELVMGMDTPATLAEKELESWRKKLGLKTNELPQSTVNKLGTKPPTPEQLSAANSYLESTIVTVLSILLVGFYVYATSRA